MPSIVQFIHPGNEHKPDNPQLNNSIDWNSGNHRRKFMTAQGKFVDPINNIKETELMFWGEWEPPSSIIGPLVRPNDFYPKWIHSRKLPVNIPQHTGELQNTDPYIFEGPFKYLLCKQSRASGKTPTQVQRTSLSNLDVGSLILFGSYGKYVKEEFFQLDTVFVVKSKHPYDTAANNSTKIINLTNQRYYETTYLRAYPLRTYYHLIQTLYLGVTYDERHESNNIYSFVPCKTLESGIGFPRIRIGHPTYITNNLSQGQKITDATDQQIADFWKYIVDVTRLPGNNCLPGVEFN